MLVVAVEDEPITTPCAVRPRIPLQYSPLGCGDGVRGDEGPEARGMLVDGRRGKKVVVIEREVSGREVVGR